MQVTDRVCVVTGGGSGIGKALCERFAAQGARTIIVVDRAADHARAVAESVGGLAEIVDVGVAAEITEMLERIERDHGPIDVLCNNAGIASGGDPLSTPIDEWQRQWDINVMSHVHAVRAVLPAMLARGEGHIQHTASMAGILTSHGNAPYATSKHAVVGLAEWLSITYHDRGIRVYLLAPLGVRTPMLGPQADSEWARAAAGPLKDPIAQEWMEFKTAEPEKWLRGMRKLQARIQAAER
jgi:NAD(P)-dependent dehydrogenase (short-subunit alcohol dehydrogenase family)